MPRVSARPLKIGLNALYLDPGRSGGPETYLRELVPALARQAPELRLVIFTTRRGARALRQDDWEDLAKIHALPADEGERGRRFIAEQVLAPRAAQREGCALLHSLASIAPVRPPLPSVITLHDVIFFKLRTFSLVTTFGMRWTVAHSVRRADRLIAISSVARDEICEVLGLDPGRFDVIPHGAGRLPSTPPTEEAVVRRRYALDGRRVVLCVAAKRPHKNQELLVRAMSELPDDVVVVLAGHPEPYDAELRRLAHRLGVLERVRFTDYVPDDDLERLWRLADCAAFPTKAEGFGLPLLEAMQRGVPIACSDIPVLREIAADVARYFHPDDPRGAAAAIVAAFGDPAAREAGLRRALRFSWDTAAQATVQAYESALTR